MNAIEVENVSKKYVLHREKPTLLKDIFLRPVKRHNTTEDFWALKDISFGVKKGEAVGIIGDNGAGKSTLLKILTGVTKPTGGTIKVKGRVGALLELGAGFHPDLTGRENVYLNGSILGLTKNDIDKKFDEIVDFSGIEEFIDTPVRTYSSGMFVRLGFSVAVHMEPEILIIDEVLSVGDMLFVQKCLNKLEEFQEKGVTIIFVSHDMNMIKKNCNYAILLDRGEVIDRGESKEIVDVYHALVFRQVEADLKGETFSSKELAARRVSGRSQQYGTGEVEIIDVALLNSKGILVGTVLSSEEGIFRIKVRFNAIIKDVVVGITVRDKRGLDIYGVNTLWRNKKIEQCKPGDLVVVDFRQRMMLGGGEYIVNVAINEKRPEGLRRIDWISDIILFNVVQSEEFLGFCNLDSDISVKFT